MEEVVVGNGGCETEIYPSHVWKVGKDYGRAGMPNQPWTHGEFLLMMSIIGDTKETITELSINV